MNILLDTHALLWWLGGESIDPDAAAAIADPGNVVAVSAASAWEIAIKASIGKLHVEGDLGAAISASRFEPLPITLPHAFAVRELPQHHRDPFDRMLIAQARLEDCAIATRDSTFDAYDVRVLPV